MKASIPVFLTILALYTYSYGGAKDGGAASTCTKNNKVSIADLCFELQHSNIYKPSEDLKKNIDRILINSAPFYNSNEQLSLVSKEFRNQIYGETKEFFLVDKLPKNCEQLDPDNMGDNVKIHDLACTKGYKVFLVKKELAKLDTLQLSLALIHEGIHGFSQTEAKYIDHSDIALIIKALNLIETIYIPAVESFNTEEIFNPEQVSLLKSLSKVLFHFFGQNKFVDVGLNKRGVFSNRDFSEVDTSDLTITTGSQLFFENTHSSINFDNVRIENSKLNLGHKLGKDEKFIFKNIVLTNSNFTSKLSTGFFNSSIRNSNFHINFSNRPDRSSTITLDEIEVNADSVFTIDLEYSVLADLRSEETYKISKVKLLNNSNLDIFYPYGNKVNDTSDVYLNNSAFVNLKGGSKKISLIDSVFHLQDVNLNTYLGDVYVDKSSRVVVIGDIHLSQSNISASNLDIRGSKIDNTDILNSSFGDIRIKKNPGEKLIINGVSLDKKGSNNKWMYHTLTFKNDMILSNMDIITEKCHGKLVFSNKKAESWDGSGGIFVPKDSTGVFTSKGYCEFSTFDKLKKYEVE